MNVYLYPSNTETELQNIYIGELYSWPLRFKAEEANSTIQLNKTGSPTSVTLETSRDGKTWSTYTFWTAITLSNIWDKVFFRNTSTTTTAFSIDFENRYSFTMTWSIAWSWDVTTLVNKSWTDTLVGTECFRRLFYNCTSLTSSPELPAKSLTNSCYMQMFSLCTSLTTVPELPATTLADMCYNSMFLWCTALTSAPELPASTMANQCYYMMFRWCTALTTPPKLSSTALASSCYREMFNWCTSLETLPKLPATTLAAYCYRFMFKNCSKIKLSTTQTWAYQTAYRIPTTWTWTDWGSACDNMFTSTGWTFTWTPSLNTTYYTSNNVV